MNSSEENIKKLIFDGRIITYRLIYHCVLFKEVILEEELNDLYFAINFEDIDLIKYLLETRENIKEMFEHTYFYTTKLNPYKNNFFRLCCGEVLDNKDIGFREKIIEMFKEKGYDI